MLVYPEQSAHPIIGYIKVICNLCYSLFAMEGIFFFLERRMRTARHFI